jgi:multidrug resistance efflux pump
MKMQTTVYAPADGIVDEVLVQVGDTVQSKVALMAPVWTRPAPHHLHLAPR